MRLKPINRHQYIKLGKWPFGLKAQGHHPKRDSAQQDHQQPDQRPSRQKPGGAHALIRSLSAKVIRDGDVGNPGQFNL